MCCVAVLKLNTAQFFPFFEKYLADFTMYLIPTLTIALGTLNMVAGNLELRPAGWLDKLVHYHRERLLNDIRKEAPIQIKASLQPCPEGYVDSPDWNETSVFHLLTLLQRSEGTKDVRRALRRAMGPSRRFMSAGESWKYFPSKAKVHPSYFYYPDYSEEKMVENFEGFNEHDEEAVLQISNPVESRLPSAQISVRLLKRILEARAMAARVLPTTKRTTMEWKTKPKTPTTAKAGEASSDVADTAPGETTPAVDHGDNTTASGDDTAASGDGASVTGDTASSDDGASSGDAASSDDGSNVADDATEPERRELDKLKADITKPTTGPPTTETLVPTTETPPPPTEARTTKRKGKQEHMNDQF